MARLVPNVEVETVVKVAIGIFSFAFLYHENNGVDGGSTDSISNNRCNDMCRTAVSNANANADEQKKKGFSTSPELKEEGHEEGQGQGQLPYPNRDPTI
jgi:hypothetical protein